ncbi:MAG: flagellar biosynthesis protein FlhA [Rhodocyclaceae bacterium]
MRFLKGLVAANRDMAMVVLVLAVLVVLFTPIPSVLLDFLILSNFSFAFLILLLTFYMGRPVEFSTFPSLLLIATLFRLSLNVAATRLILSHGDAGKVIGAIGSYVVGGNYVIGLIVFLILIVVQYVVVTSGAQRVSEVAARFTLDSMPGQQMSIDADLNMGFIDQEEAQRRRKNIEKEAAFYGAMDGASKFVKGDAIAGIVILLINSIGGLLIGVMQLNMRWGDALQTYTLLTIGDGIVTQVPALVISVGTGIIVTRSASDANLSREVMAQITSFPKTLFMVGAALFVAGCLPGIPAIPAFMLTALLLGMGWLSWRARSIVGDATQAVETGSLLASADGTAASASAEVVPVHQIEVLVGAAWSAFAQDNGAGPLGERIAVFRRQCVQDLGLMLPSVHFGSKASLQSSQYEIHLDGVLVARGESNANKILAIHPSGDTKSLRGEVTRDPTYGLPALWIDESLREAATAANFTLVDGMTVLVTHLTEVLRRNSATLLTRSETERLLNSIRQSQPGLVEEIIPTLLTVGDVQKVLQGLLREKVSIRNIGAIMETLADAARFSKDPAQLGEAIRSRLGQAICQSLLGDSMSLQVMTLDPGVEAQLMQALTAAEGRQLALEPRVVEQLLMRVVQGSERMMKNNLLPILLCAPDLRRHLRTLTERVMPHLRVLSMTEVPPTVELKSYSTLSL